MAEKKSKRAKGKRGKAILVLCLGILLIGIAAGLFFSPQQAGPGAPNIVIICLDTLRADHLGCYGYHRDTTPHIDRFAAQGVLFEQTLSQAPWTLPAHVSLFSSLYPSRHGVHRHDLAIRRRDKLFADILSKAGYATAGFVDVFLLSRKYGFQRGFDTFRDEGEDKGAGQMVDQAIEWLSGRQGKQPFFLFLHLFDPHSAYSAPPPFSGRWSKKYPSEFRPDTDSLFQVRTKKRTFAPIELAHVVACYDEEIAYADDELGRFFAYLRQAGLYDSSLIVFLSDHGEEFLEHGGVLHGVSLYDELVMVPLIVRLPQGRLAGRRIAEQVQLIDVAPTLLELAGLRSPRSFQGISLASYMDGSARLSGYSGFSEADHMGAGHNVKRCLRTNEYKYYYDIRTRQGKLYNLLRDPSERVDLSAEYSGLAQEMREELFAWMESEGDERRVPSLKLSAAEERQLRSLGYLH